LVEYYQHGPPSRPDPQEKDEQASQSRGFGDGTKIAFDELGDGPPLIMVVGAFNTRATSEPLAHALEDRFTVLNYDRRGRGDSGDTPPYAVEREIEDIDALIAHAGGSAAVFGYSSGATLALKAAAHGLQITQLALYDAPFLVDDSYPRLPEDFAEQLGTVITAGRRGDAVELYQTTAIGIPQEVVVQMRQVPFRPALEAIAHTLVYEATVVGDLSFPADLVASITVPTVVIDGEHSPPIMHGAAEALVRTLPNGRRRTLPGQSHDISPEAMAPVLTELLAG
jgi:pimeloyl-ACP methyl ester carboxylesterase